MRVERISVICITLPLRSAFQTAYGREESRDILLVKVDTAQEGAGWGECVASRQPHSSSEYVNAARDVLIRHCAPILLGQELNGPAHASFLLSRIPGHRMAKGALEMALLDAELRSSGMSLRDYLGGVRQEVEVGVSIGIQASTQELIDVVAKHLEDGYKRIKIKIQPGWDLLPVRHLREEFGDIPLQVDGNAAYSRQDFPLLKDLDKFDLLMIEQPLASNDLGGHARLARMIQTPLCLDESITSMLDVLEAFRQDSCSIVNVKAGRVGGYLEARRIHDLCYAINVPVWCGGMLETGLGRAANLALASLPGFVLPGDISATSRY